MSYGMGTAGTTTLVADGAVGKSGGRIRLFQATCLSDGTARDLVLRNGTTDAGTVYVQAAGDASNTVTINFGEEGIVFPDGCFFDIGSAVSGTFTYRVEL